jgi:hypothetical protein
MLDLSRKRERYLRDEPPIRLGNLASSLLRLSHWVRRPERDDASLDLMREIAWLFEWNADFANAEMADMQREICRWRRVWPLDPARSLLAFRARLMSERVLETSGLRETAAVGT